MNDESSYYLDREDGTTSSGTIQEGATIRDILEKEGYTDDQINSGLTLFQNAINATSETIVDSETGETHIALQVKIDNG